MKKQSYSIFCDFDGTITLKDTLDVLFESYVSHSDLTYYASLWEQGKIGSSECLQQLFQRVEISEKDLQDFIQSIEIDKSFITLLKKIKNVDADTKINIISDGVDMIIEKVIETNDLTQYIDSIYCNNLSHLKKENKVLFSTYNSIQSICEHENTCALCKSALINREISNLNNSTTIYIGDGQSDYYGAMKTDIVFAKGKLYGYLSDKREKVYKFDTFSDIENHLKSSSFNELIFSA